MSTQPDCTCAMTEASQFNCALHGTDDARMPQAPGDPRFCSCGAERGHYGWQACAAGLPRAEPCFEHYPGYDESCAACMAVAQLVHQRLVAVDDFETRSSG
jgi:hypothetical protein